MGYEHEELRGFGFKHDPYTGDLFGDPKGPAKPKRIDCGELIEVNGEYVPAE